MASASHGSGEGEPKPEPEPLVGVSGAKPPEAENILARRQCQTPKGVTDLPSGYFRELCYSRATSATLCHYSPKAANIANTILWAQRRTAFSRSAITPAKVNRFG